MNELETQVMLQLFNEWLDEKHPYFRATVGLIFILFTILFFLCLVSLWVYSFEISAKILITTSVLFIFFKLIVNWNTTRLINIFYKELKNQ
jgi:ABC-type transport system involved in cytochrome bd biosynthesis fused ATPase/permease subunit